MKIFLSIAEKLTKQKSAFPILENILVSGGFMRTAQAYIPKVGSADHNRHGGVAVEVYAKHPAPEWLPEGLYDAAAFLNMFKSREVLGATKAEDKVTFTFRTGSFTMSQSGEPDDFPIEPDLRLVASTPLNDHLQRIKTVVGFAADNELCPVMNGVCLYPTRSGKTAAISTDAHALAECYLPEDFDALKGTNIPATFFKLLPADLYKHQGVTLSRTRLTSADLEDEKTKAAQEKNCKGSSANFEEVGGYYSLLTFEEGGFGQNTEVYTKEIEGHFPKYENIFPDRHTAKFITLPAEALRALKAVEGLVTRKQTQLVRLTLEDLDGVTLHKRNIDYVVEASEASEELHDKGAEGEIEIGLHPALLEKILKSCGKAPVVFKFLDPSKGVIFETDEFKFLLMPKMLA